MNKILKELKRRATIYARDPDRKAKEIEDFKKSLKQCTELKDDKNN